jgi:CRP-like cAMP-binding protein
LTPLRVIESLSRRTAELLVPVGGTVVREGEPGDRFYLVLSGTLEVSRGGRSVRQLGAGASFGEIALLHEGLRTATVTAVEPARLAVVGRHDFLTALGSERATRTAAEGVAASHLSADAQAAQPGSGS